MRTDDDAEHPFALSAERQLAMIARAECLRKQA